MGDEQTLIRRVGQEVGPALDRYQACNGGNHSSMCAAIGPLVAANMGLEDEPREAREDGQSRAELVTVLDVRRREIDRLNGVIANLREVIAQASAAQAAGRDQASEIERLRGEIADATETIKGADESRKGYVAEIQRLKLYVDALKSDLGVVRASLSAAEREADRHQNRTQRLQHAVKALAAMVVDADRTRGQS